MCSQVVHLSFISIPQIPPLDLILGLRYMCIEQRKAFEAVIECIDAQADEVDKGKKISAQ